NSKIFHKLLTIIITNNFYCIHGDILYVYNTIKTFYSKGDLDFRVEKRFSDNKLIYQFANLGLFLKINDKKNDRREDYVSQCSYSTASLT
ncbi:hypothetical protein HZS_1112, partial [Henneguya salminicola]